MVREDGRVREASAVDMTRTCSAFSAGQAIGITMVSLPMWSLTALDANELVRARHHFVS